MHGASSSSTCNWWVYYVVVADHATHQVFFHVHLTSSSGSNNPIVYKGVASNVGGGYSTTTGYFTAPLPGSYLFIFTIVHSGDDVDAYTSAGLYVKGSLVSYAWGESAASGSNHAVAHLSAGDKVWVSGTVSELEADVYSTFSGALIQGDF